MAVQLKKTYRGLNPEMLYDEIRHLVSRHGLGAAEARLQTYSVSSGATQSRVTTQMRTSDGKECGTLHIIGSANGDARMTVDLDDTVVSDEVAKALQEDIDFMLGSYEVRW